MSNGFVSYRTRGDEIFRLPGGIRRPGVPPPNSRRLEGQPLTDVGSMSAAYGKPVQRVFLKRLDNGEQREFPLNPTEMTEQFSVDYGAAQIVGLSHKPLQYQGTGNGQFGLELAADLLVKAWELGKSQDETTEIDDFRNYLIALTARLRDGPRAAETPAPPVILLVWPGFLTVRCVVRNVNFTYKRWTRNNQLALYTAQCTFEEARRRPVSGAELRAGIGRQ